MPRDGWDDRDDRLLRAVERAPLISESDINAAVDGGYRIDHRGAADLTPREAEVLLCLSHGLDQKMTAETLGIGTETVQTHLKRARYGLKAKTTIHAVAIALRAGLI